MQRTHLWDHRLEKKPRRAKVVVEVEQVGQEGLRMGNGGRRALEMMQRSGNIRKCFLKSFHKCCFSKYYIVN